VIKKMPLKSSFSKDVASVYCLSIPHCYFRKDYELLGFQEAGNFFLLGKIHLRNFLGRTRKG